MMLGTTEAGIERGTRGIAQAALAAARPTGETGFISGYASLFGVTDQMGDAIEPGAFRASVARRGAGGIRMLWQHDPGRPIGVWTAVGEDSVGLFVEGRLALSTEGGREAFALVEAGAVDGLSIGFRTRRARKGGAGEAARRRLTEIDLWEISIVTFPMQERARVLEARRGGGVGDGHSEDAPAGEWPVGERAARIAAAVLGLGGDGAPTRPARPRQGVG